MSLETWLSALSKCLLYLVLLKRKRLYKRLTFEEVDMMLPYHQVVLSGGPHCGRI